MSFIRLNDNICIHTYINIVALNSECTGIRSLVRQSDSLKVPNFNFPVNLNKEALIYIISEVFININLFHFSCYETKWEKSVELSDHHYLPTHSSKLWKIYRSTDTSEARRLKLRCKWFLLFSVIERSGIYSSFSSWLCSTDLRCRRFLFLLC